jgi:hypothetical protein
MVSGLGYSTRDANTSGCPSNDNFSIVLAKGEVVMVRKRAGRRSRETCNTSILRNVKLCRRGRTLRRCVTRVAWTIDAGISGFILERTMDSDSDMFIFQDIGEVGGVMGSRRRMISLLVLLATNGSLRQYQN